MNYIVPIHTVDVSGEELIAATTHKKTRSKRTRSCHSDIDLEGWR